MRELLYDPFLVWVLAGIVLSFGLNATRFAKWGLMVVALVLLVSIEGAIFDGRQHLTHKFDATFLVWGRAVQLRAVAGVAFVSLGAATGRVVAKQLALPRGVLLGVLAFGPFGLGLFISSIVLQSALRTILSEAVSAEVRSQQLRTAIEQSTWWVSGGTLASVAACVAVVIVVTRFHAK